jgi:hypothetical protein
MRIAQSLIFGQSSFITSFPKEAVEYAKGDPLSSFDGCVDEACLPKKKRVPHPAPTKSSRQLDAPQLRRAQPNA